MYGKRFKIRAGKIVLEQHWRAVQFTRRMMRLRFDELRSLRMQTRITREYA